MKISQFEEILDQYEFRKTGYSLFEKYSDWFAESSKNGALKIILERTLIEVNQNLDLRKFDFVLLIIQAFSIDFTREDKHFEFLFSIADSITKDFKVSKLGDKKSWILHQLTDICIHHYDKIAVVVKRKPKLILSVLEKIGEVKYESQGHGAQMYFAAYKAIGLVELLPTKERKEILEEIYLKHFDERVIDDAEELIEYLKEVGQYD